MPTDTDTDRQLIAVAVLASFVAFLDGSVVNLALPAIGREFGGADDVGNGDSAAWLQNAECFAEHLRLVRRKIYDAIRDDGVNGVVSNGNIFDLAEPKFDIGGVAFSRVIARFG